VYFNSIVSKCNVVYCGTMNENDWVHDTWSINIQTNKNDVIKVENFVFKTGVGHRVDLTNSHGRLSVKQQGEVKKLKICYNATNSTGFIHTIGNTRSIILTPTQTSFMYCLLLDATAREESFNDWCLNYGYDNDSMKAFDTYQSCCKIGKQLESLFKREQIETMRSLLEEY
jgi:hypothetical protein